MERKVAILIHSLTTGGSEKLAIETARMLSADIFVMENDIELDARNIEVKRLSYITNQSPPLMKWLNILACFFKMTKEIENYDVVISYLERANILASMLKTYSRNKLTLLINNESNLGYKFAGNRFLISKIIYYFYKNADRIICKSHNNKADLDIFVKPNTFKNIHVVYPPSLLKPTKTNKPEKLKNPDFFLSNKVVVCIGRLHKTKGYWLALAIAAKLKSIDPSYKLLVIGAGNELERLISYSNALNLNTATEEDIGRSMKDVDVLFSGRQENVLPELQESCILLSTSYSESFGIVIAEALAAGTPSAVCLCDGGSIEIITDEKNIHIPYRNSYGIILPPTPTCSYQINFDASTWANLINDFITQAPSTKEELKESMRVRSERFSYDSYKRNVISLFNNTN